MSERDWYAGSCHCGAVRFRVRLGQLSAVDCNCSMCRRKGFLHLFVEPDDFVLEQGGDVLSEYRFGTRTAVHRFCRTCGIHPFYTARSHPNHVDVNARCLEPSVLEQLEVEPFDGDNWEANVDRIR